MSKHLLWNVPVPARRGGFSALFPEHQLHDVEVDLGRISAFGLPETGGELLYADLQTNCDMNIPGRLGSGRAAFHRGVYLKGIGRTPLAANWADPVDIYHATGHLNASAAARELIVSRYLGGTAASAGIVPCTGVLVKPLAPALDGFLDRSFPHHDWRDTRPACDDALQALSIKPGGFARMSNLTWLLDHWSYLGGESFLAHVFETISHFTAPQGKAAGSTPEGIAASLAASFDRALAHFAAFLEAGVYWGSFHNNFTLDGRFLDLELPTLLASPCLAGKTSAAAVSETSDVRFFKIGTEIFGLVRQVRLFLRHLRHRLAFVAEALVTTELERDFIAAFRNALDNSLREHPMTSDAALLDFVRTIYRTKFKAEGAGARWLDTFAERALRFHLYGELAELPSIRLRRHPLRFSITEPGVRPVVWTAHFVPDPKPEDVERLQVLHARIDALDATTDPEEFLAKLHGFC